MPDLTSFLLARISEDEELAQGLRLSWQRWVLAECATKRRIIDGLDDGHAIRERHVLLALANVYADHPDFDPSWRVE